MCIEEAASVDICWSYDAGLEVTIAEFFYCEE